MAPGLLPGLSPAQTLYSLSLLPTSSSSLLVCEGEMHMGLLFSTSPSHGRSSLWIYINHWPPQMCLSNLRSFSSCALEGSPYFLAFPLVSLRISYPVGSELNSDCSLKGLAPLVNSAILPRLAPNSMTLPHSSQMSPILS